MASVSVSIDDKMLKKIDRVAKKTSISRSQILRLAAARYLDDQDGWEKIFSYGEQLKKQRSLKETEVLKVIKKYRQTKNKQNILG